MNALIDHRKKLIIQNRREYGLYYGQLKKVGYYTAMEMENRRDLLTVENQQGVDFFFNRTKPFVHGISPGCKLCGEGEWSCLFMNNRCNCTCFYCPAPQTNDHPPETQGMSFDDPATYVAYLKKFGFKGASISGGEPLLTFDLTINFLREIKKAMGSEIYLWLYTNGALLTKSRAKMLAGTGLDEIRFDLSATKYSTRFLKHVLGLIPNVTVEIPAIPEDTDRLKTCVVELDKLGVNFLNLHQLRLTPFNLEKLVQRNYTFLHGPKMTVMESELAALEIIRFVMDEGLRLPVNYCSFHYKNNFQKAGFRNKFGKWLLTPYEELTLGGYIRRIEAKATDEALNRFAKVLPVSGEAAVEWEHEPTTGIINLKTQMIKHLPADDDLFVAYFSVQLSAQAKNDAMEIPLENGVSVFLQKSTASSRITISPDNRDAFLKIADGQFVETIHFSDDLFTIARHELPAGGFQDYF